MEVLGVFIEINGNQEEEKRRYEPCIHVLEFSKRARNKININTFTGELPKSVN